MDEVILGYLGIPEPKSTFLKEKLFNEEFFTDFHKYRMITRILDNKIHQSEKLLESLPEGEEKTKIKTKIEITKNLRGEFTGFHSQIIETRNKMAHAKCLDPKKNILSCKEGDVEYDEKSCIEIRKNLIKYSKKLDDISDNLKEL
jgi:hypothetical protein